MKSSLHYCYYYNVSIFTSLYSLEKLPFTDLCSQLKTQELHFTLECIFQFKSTRNKIEFHLSEQYFRNYVYAITCLNLYLYLSIYLHIHTSIIYTLYFKKIIRPNKSNSNINSHWSSPYLRVKWNFQVIKIVSYLLSTLAS